MCEPVFYLFQESHKMMCHNNALKCWIWFLFLVQKLSWYDRICGKIKTLSIQLCVFRKKLQIMGWSSNVTNVIWNTSLEINLTNTMLQNTKWSVTNVSNVIWNIHRLKAFICMCVTNIMAKNSAVTVVTFKQESQVENNKWLLIGDWNTENKNWNVACVILKLITPQCYVITRNVFMTELKKGLIATNVIIAVATDTILIIIQDKCTIQGKTWSNVINVCIKQLRSPIWKAHQTET